jgi:hypothetical protein
MWTHGLSQIRSCPGRMPALMTRLERPRCPLEFVKEPASSSNAAAWSCWANYPSGLAHELNNFGPTAKRAADQRRYTLTTMRSANFEIAAAAPG